MHSPICGVSWLRPIPSRPPSSSPKSRTKLDQVQRGDGLLAHTAAPSRDQETTSAPFSHTVRDPETSRQDRRPTGCGSSGPHKAPCLTR